MMKASAFKGTEAGKMSNSQDNGRKVNNSASGLTPVQSDSENDEVN